MESKRKKKANQNQACCQKYNNSVELTLFMFLCFFYVFFLSAVNK